MTEQTQPEALRLADLLDTQVSRFGETQRGSKALAAAELRRLHAENEQLKAQLARESIASAEQKARDMIQPSGNSGWLPAQKPLIARQLGEWHEDDGPVAWWAWCGHGWAGEPAWIGTPNDSDWPGYHTHWTPHPDQPAAHGIGAPT